WWRDGRFTRLPGMGTLNAAQRLLALSDVRDVRGGEHSPSVGLATIALPGAVGKLLWQALLALLARHPDLTVLVADGTRLFIDAPELAAFTQAGGKLYAVRGIEVIGLALNPCSPFGG